MRGGVGTLRKGEREGAGAEKEGGGGVCAADADDPASLNANV